MVSRKSLIYKQIGLDSLPVGWEVKNLQGITTKITDGAHHTPTYTAEGVPFLRVTDIKKSNVDWNKTKYVSQEEHEMLIKRCHPEKGDILLSKNGTIGAVKIVDWDKPFSIFVSLCLIKVDKERIDNEYLSFYLESNVVFTQYKLRAKTGTVTNLHLEEIRELLIAIPPFKEQKKIVSILSSVEQVIEKTELVIEQTEKVKKGLMQQLFTKGIGHTEFKETEIGEIPEEWEVKAFSDVMVLQRGFDLPTHSRKKGQYPLMSANGLTDSHSEYKVEGPGIVTGRSGTIGKVHYVEENFWPLNTTLYVKEIYGNNPKFLYYLLSNFRLERFSTGTGVPTLNRNVVHPEKIALPPVHEQKKIALILTKADMRIINEKQYLQELLNLKKGLMQSLLTGKVRVKVDEAEVTQV